MHSSRMHTVRSSSRLCSGGVYSQGRLLLGSAPGEWGVSAPRGCLLLGVSAPRGVCSRGVSAPGEVSALGGLVHGLPGMGGAWSQRGGGGGIPACTEADLPVNRMTDRCKNITFANFVCRL